jgi:hypothetical protein
LQVPDHSFADISRFFQKACRQTASDVKAGKWRGISSSTTLVQKAAGRALTAERSRTDAMRRVPGHCATGVAALKAGSEIKWLGDNGSYYIADENTDVLEKGRPATHHKAGPKSAEQRDGRKLGQNDEDRLRYLDAQAGRENSAAEPGHRMRPLQAIASTQRLEIPLAT